MSVLPYAIAVAAACFLYVAVADLIPGLHRRVSARESMAQVILICARHRRDRVVEQHAH